MTGADLVALPAPRFFARLRTWSLVDVDAAMWVRCRTDRAMFCSAMFPERFPLPFNALHRSFLARPKTAWRERSTTVKEVDAAPREAAKSTIRSFAEVVHDVVYGLELYVALISTTYDLAEDLVKDLHGVLTDAEGYPDLHRIYGPIEVAGTATDFVVTCPTGEPRGTRIKAFSFGGTIRGTKHDGGRPTKVIMDDSEHPEKVRSPGQRAKQWAFLTKDILKAGGPTTLYQVVGTVLHADSMLARLLKAPAWRAELFRAVLAWPERMDLWAVAREIWSDLTDPDRVASVAAFYAANQAAMDAGAAVLWPEREPLLALMELWWEDAAAFNSEKQNNPVDPSRQVYDPDTFRRCSFDGVHITNSSGRRVRVRDCRLALWLDPRASRELERNDYAAIALVALDEHGYCYVLAIDMQRDAPSAQRARLWAWYERYPDASIGYEDNGFQALYGDDFDREREARRKAGRPWRMSPQGHRSTSSKNDRMISLEPDVLNGWLEFADDLPQSALEQWRDIPSGTHDDSPDAVERAVWLVRGGGVPDVEAG